MRQTLLTITLLTVVTFSHAQYSSMLEEGSEWYYYFWFEASCNETLRVQGDSLIDGVSYKQIRTDEPCNHDYVTLLREDSATKQVFLWRSNNTEILIYDYSLEAGDTLFFDPTYYDYFLVLDSISNVLPENNSCVEGMYPMTTLDEPKVFYWGTTDIYDQVIWIEGIGNITDPLNSIYTWTEGALGDQLLCHIDSEGTKDYHDLSFFCEEPVFCEGPLLNTRDFAKFSKQLQVYPNPAANEVRINGLSEIGEELKQISFFDVTGQLLKTQALRSSESVDIADLKSGLIIGIVQTENGDRYSLKFVKN